MLKKLRDRYLMVFAVAFGLGCATHAVANLVQVAAQSEPAQGVYRECIAASVYATTGRRLNQGEMPDDTTRIPAGWHVVGGAGSAPFVVLCR